MEGRFYSWLKNTVHEVQRYFYLYSIEHLNHAPPGDVWDNAYGHAHTVGKVVHSLAKRANANIVLVGQEGVGSLGIAKKAAEQLKERVLFVDIEELFQTSTGGIHRLHVLATMLSEMERSGNVIVVLSGLAGVFSGKYKILPEDILHPFFASPSVRTITILSDEEYHAHIAGNKELSRFVDIVPVKSLSGEHTKQFLTNSFASSIPQDVLDEVVRKTETLFPHVPHPKRAIDIVQRMHADNTISKEHVLHHISQKVGFDIRRLNDIELPEVEKTIRAHVVNQNEAIRELVNGLLRGGHNAGTKRPIASLLFMGPRGVGKMETARTLALAYFGSADRIVEVNIERLQEEFPSIAIESPFCVLIVTGLENASSTAGSTFQSLITNGSLPDAFGRDYFASNMIVIAKTSYEEPSLYPEGLLASFDGVLRFTALHEKHISEIARRMLARINGKLQIEHDVSLHVSDGLIDHIVQQGYTEEFGAHGMENIVQSVVAQKANELITKGAVIPGGVIRLNY